jgi:hypothetical protein
MARGGAGKRPHSPGSDEEGNPLITSVAAFPEEGVYPITDPSFPRNPFIENLDLDDEDNEDRESDDEADLDNTFAPIAPHGEVIFDPPARRPSLRPSPVNRGNASPITESETDSVMGETSTAWSAVRGPVQKDFGGGIVGGDEMVLLRASSRGPVTTVNDKGVLVIRQDSSAGMFRQGPWFYSSQEASAFD